MLCQVIRDNVGMGGDNGSDVEYPDTLRVEVGTLDDVFDGAIETAEAVADGTAKTGADAEAVVTFSSVSHLWNVLTEDRIAIVESLIAQPAESMSQLAERLDRTASAVHDDVDVLVDTGIVKRRMSGTTTELLVPYEAVAIEIELSPDKE